MSKSATTLQLLRSGITSIAFLLLVVVVVATAVRIVREHQTPGPFDTTHQGFCDFQNGVYFPSLAFRLGLSPYGQVYATTYPVERSVPFFSPVILAAHVPFTWLELHAAEVVYFVWMLALVATIAACITTWHRSECRLTPTDGTVVGWSWQLFACLALALVATRSGQQTLFTGYFTFELILASLVAVHFGHSRPWLSALALVIVSAKPNYVLPIALLMLCRGNFKAVIWGGIVSATLAAAAFYWILPEAGFGELLTQIQQTQEIHRSDPIERPVNNWIRIDALAIVAKWTATDPNEVTTLAVMIVMLLPTGYLLWRYHRPFRKRELGNPFPTHSNSALGLSGAVVLLTSIVSVYHHVYDGLTLLAPAAALIMGAEDWRQTPKRMRGFLSACLLFPAVNYLSSQKLLNWLDGGDVAFQVITSINAAVLMIAWLIMLTLLKRRLRHSAND